MLSFKEFILEKKDIHTGDFVVTKDMVTDGKLNRKLPKEINGDFTCYYLELESLKGCPEIVNGYCDVRNNKLTDLVGAPKRTNVFYAPNNKLTTLKGCPIKTGSINLENNKLTNLEYFPLERTSNIIRLLNNANDLHTELSFILSGKCTNTEPDLYWPNLLKFMMDEKISLDDVKGWPKGFLNPELIQSVSGISKYNL